MNDPLVTWSSHDWFLTSLEDLGIEEAEATYWEDVDLDELPWSPIRPALQPLAGAETSSTEPSTLDIDMDFVTSWEARTDVNDRYAQEWLLDQRNRLHQEQLEADTRLPIGDPRRRIRDTWDIFDGLWVATCTICHSIVLRNQYAQHWQMCKDDVGQGEP